MGHVWVSVGVVIAVAAATVIVPKWSWVLVGFCLLGVVSGTVAQSRIDAVVASVLPGGFVDVMLVVTEDQSASSWGLGVADVVRIDDLPVDGARVGVRNLPDTVTVGALIAASGTMQPGPRWVKGEVVAGTLTIDDVHETLVSANPVLATGNAIRAAVTARYPGDRRTDGLLSGFLIGDTAAMLVADQENLRLAGLSHFVAVSGSNVALFLVIWWFVTAPLSMHRQFRVLLGGIGLWIFAVVTRWEASVIRASAMAAVPLVGGWVGVPIDPWTALGVAVTFLVLVSGHLTTEVGFQLSVLATAGVIGGIELARGRRPRWLTIPLFTTLGAQVAVAPLLLAVFGSVPLLAPLTNLVVAPVVAATTAVAAAGVVFAPCAGLAHLGAAFVLWIAQAASSGPQLGVIGVIVGVLIGAAAAFRRTRFVGLAIGLVVLAIAMPGPSSWPATAQATVLDVGQGDAILIQDPSGESLLFDGGADPRILDRALRRNGVTSVATTVVSHPDNDHAGGLAEIVSEARTGRLIVSAFVPPFDLVAVAEQSGVPVETVQAGDQIKVGTIAIDVLSPSRRYASDNDGSIVLFLKTPVSMLLPGDIERVAQLELPEVYPDVLVVPHHGSGTTDRGWLARTLGPVAVLSYGPNRFGHPHADIIDVLRSSHAVVRETNVDGDITIPLMP